MHIFKFCFLGRSRGVSCTFRTIETRKKKLTSPKMGENPLFWPQNDSSFCGGGTFLTVYIYIFLVSVIHKVHDTPLDLPKKWNWKIFIFKKVIKVTSPQNDKSSFCGPKMGFSPRFGGRENFFFWLLWFRKYMTHL